jgi:carbon-monoxide dehydrogenase large subunit
VSILGNRVVRREDPRFLTVGGTYVDDVKVDGAVHVHYVRSTMAHARITSIDVSDARKADGVLAVYTADDVDLEPIPSNNPAMPRPWLASDVVRYVGEPVAAIVTEERYQGPDAAELVWIDYDPLPAVVDPEEAMSATGDALLFPETGSNVAMDFAMIGMGDQFTDDLFDGCDVVVRQRLVNHRVAPCPMEPRAALATWDDEGRLVHYACTQMPNTLKDELAARYGLDPAQVHVIAPDVGGGFGAKSGIYNEEHLLGWVAKQLGRPARWVETRTESMLTLGHGRGQINYIELGADKDGKVLAFRNRVVQEAGAYPLIGAFLPFMTRLLASGVYAIPKIEVNAQSVLTTTTPTVAYRGAGRPEATYAIERGMDLLAAELGLDPIEVRRRNFVQPDQFPYATASGANYDSGDYEKALDLALATADYDGLRAEQRRRRDANDPVQMGVGLAAYVEITSPIPGGEYGAVEVTPEGTARVLAGTFSHGQGHHTAFAMIVADKLGIDIDDIEFVQGDTDVIRAGHGTAGSRSLQTAGAAISEASTQVLDRARELAAQLLEANPDDLVLDVADGRWHVAGTPAAAKTWAELGAAAAQQGQTLRADVDFTPVGPTFPFGVHIAVVDVDTETGRVVLSRMITVDDSGRILNPLITEGQRHGGIAQGVAQALLEEVRFDEDGNPVTANLADYGMISATELPSFELAPMETPTPHNELGAKGIGESGTIGATPAVVSAVADALSPFGIRHLDMPTTPEKVWRAINP